MDDIFDGLIEKCSIPGPIRGKELRRILHGTKAGIYFYVNWDKAREGGRDRYATYDSTNKFLCWVTKSEMESNSEVVE